MGVVEKKVNMNNGRQHTLDLVNLICGVLDGQISDGTSKVFFVVVKLFKMLMGCTVFGKMSFQHDLIQKEIIE